MYQEDVISSQRDLTVIKRSSSHLVVKAKRGPSKNTVISLNLNEKIAFFSAVIIGDGHLKREKMQIVFECTNREIIYHLTSLCKSLFNRDFNHSPIKPRLNKKPSFQFRIDSKAIYNLLREVFEIPSGKKSDVVKVPLHILRSKNNSIKAAFLIGIMVTEGGNRRRGFGLSTASKELRDNLVQLFQSLNVEVLTDKWTNKKYNKDYYGICYKRYLLKLIVNKCKDKEVREIIYKCPNLPI